MIRNPKTESNIVFHFGKSLRGFAVILLTAVFLLNAFYPWTAEAEESATTKETVYAEISWMSTVGGNAQVYLLKNGRKYKAQPCQMVESGTTVIFEVMPERGYALAKISMNGEAVLTEGVEFTFEMPDYAVYLEAAFRLSTMLFEMDAEVTFPDIDEKGSFESGSYQLDHIELIDIFGVHHPLEDVAYIQEKSLKTSFGETITEGSLKNGYSYRTVYHFHLNTNGLKYYVMDFEGIVLPEEMEDWEIAGGNYSELIIESPLFTMPGTALYPVNVISSVGGRLYLEKYEAEAGETLSVRIIPDEGYEFSRWSSAGDLPDFAKDDEALYFMMPDHPVTLMPEFTAKKSDIPAPAETKETEEIGRQNGFEKTDDIADIKHPGLINNPSGSKDGMHDFSDVTVWYIIVIVLVLGLAAFTVLFIRRHQDQFR